VTTSRSRSRGERLLAWALRRRVFGDDLIGDWLERPPGFARSAEALRLFLRFLPDTFLRRGGRAAARPSKHANRLRPYPLPPPTPGEAVSRFLLDLRMCLRGLGRQPGPVALIVVTLAVGLAANASVLRLLDVLIVRPFTFEEPDRLLMIGAQQGDREASVDGSVAAGDFLDLRASATSSVVDWIGFDTRGGNLVGAETPERLLVSLVSTGFFPTLEGKAALGSLFDAGPSDAAAPSRPLVLSHRVWQRMFGGSPSALGRAVSMEGRAYTVVGVAAKDFNFPPGTEAWVPLALSPDEAADRSSPRLGVFGRLRDGRTLDDAVAESRLFAGRLAAAHPETHRDRRYRVVTISQGFSDAGVLPIVLVWQTAALFVLLIGWVNVAHLVIARGQDRRQQFAVLGALGADRRRIVGLFLIEGLLYGLAATALALPLAALAERLLREGLPASIRQFVPGWDRIGFDATTFASVAGLALVSILAVSVWPAWRAVRAGGSAARALHGGRTASAGPGRQRARAALVVLEIALGFTLVASSNIAVRGARDVLGGRQGYDSTDVLSFRVNLPEPAYSDDARRRDAVRGVLDRIRTIPGVESAATSNILPGKGRNWTEEVMVEGDAVPEPGRAPQADYRTVSPDYLASLRIPIVAGRALRASDDADAPRVAVVSRSMAEKFWPGREAVGRRFRVVPPAGAPTATTEPRWITVVGVAGNHMHHWFDRRDYPTYFVPYAQEPRLWMHFVVRTQGPPEAFETEVRRALSSVDANLAPFEVMSLDRARAEGAIGLTFAASVMSTLAGLALVLAVSGIYGVTSYQVSARLRDLGVRVALGATQVDLLRAVIGRVAQLSAIGLVVGWGLAILAGKGLASVLRGAAHLDVPMALLAASVLALAATLAAFLPARRALMLDPVEVLRSE
jgi:putative ABC transport system permease protein